MTVLFKPILALHINFSSCQNYWGGAKRYVCPPPNIFIGGRLPPPPPGSTPLVQWRIQDLQKMGVRPARARARVPHTGGFPAGGPGGGAPGSRVSANKGLQDGRQE